MLQNLNFLAKYYNQPGAKKANRLAMLKFLEGVGVGQQPPFSLFHT